MLTSLHSFLTDFPSRLRCPSSPFYLPSPSPSNRFSLSLIPSGALSYGLRLTRSLRRCILALALRLRLLSLRFILVLLPVSLRPSGGVSVFKVSPFFILFLFHSLSFSDSNALSSSLSPRPRTRFRLRFSLAAAAHLPPSRASFLCLPVTPPSVSLSRFAQGHRFSVATRAMCRE
jgi:hypothetical protein